MDKFVYSEGDILISKSQCGICVFQDPDNETVCQKYSSKPAEILTGRVQCPYLQVATLLDL